MSDKNLTRARALFDARKYSEAISFLEPLVLEYREDPEYFKLLGIACFKTGDHGGAFTYLTKSQTFDPDDAEMHLWIAALQLKRGSAQKALDLYLRVLEMEPDNAKAKYALEILRRNQNPTDLDQWLSGKSFLRILPSTSRPFRFLPVLVSVPVAVLAVYAALSFAGSIESGRKAARPEIANVSLSESDRIDAAAFGGQYRYVMSEREIIDSFERAKDLFAGFHDQKALLEINRILNSNASPGIREKASLLASFTESPTFLNVRDPFPYGDVAKDPVLYSGCAMIWRGRMTNFESASGEASFDFLVGYDDQKQLEGIVRVHFPFPLSVDPSRAFEVLGSVVPTQSGFRLEGISIHEMVK